MRLHLIRHETFLILVTFQGQAKFKNTGKWFSTVTLNCSDNATVKTTNTASHTYYNRVTVTTKTSTEKCFTKELTLHLNLRSYFRSN